MPVGINSPARLFLLGSSGSQVVTNFFKKIDESASSNYVHEPAGISYNGDDETYVLAGYADRNSPSSNRYGWIERRQEDGTQDWGVELSSTTSSGVYLEAIDTNFANNEIIAVGRADDVPFITKYDSNGDKVWQSSSQTANVTYRGVAIGGEDYYACGSTEFLGLGNNGEAFVEKYDSFGNPGWGKSAIMLGRDVVLNDIATNSRDEVVTVGYLEDDSADKGYIVKLDGVTGKVQWDRTLQLSSINSPTAGDPVDVKVTAITIDNDDNIYVVGNIDPAPPFGTGTTPHEAFIVKYSPEGNILWQSMTDKDAGTMNGIYYNDVVVDNVTKKPTVIGRTNDNNIGGQDGVLLTRYNSDGSLSWRREVQEDAFDFRAANASGDGDQSFIYLVFNDDNDTESYVYGKVSATGNGLGDVEYNDGTGTPLLDYITTSGPNGSGVGEKIGRLSDGSVRNDTTDLITYPFNANKILFDDFATQLTNKRRQMDSADSFEYSRDVVSQYTTSAAVRPTDFQELNLLGDTGFEDETTGGGGTTTLGAQTWSNDLTTANPANGFRTQNPPTLAFDGGITNSAATNSTSAGNQIVWSPSQFPAANGPYTLEVLANGAGSDGGWGERLLKVNGTTYFDPAVDTLPTDYLTVSNLTEITEVIVERQSGTNGRSRLDVIKVNGTHLTDGQGITLPVSGTTTSKVKDQSGKGNDGVVDGATHNSEGYWEFDGVDDNIIVDDPQQKLQFVDTGSDFAIECWARRTAAGSGSFETMLSTWGQASGIDGWIFAHDA